MGRHGTASACAAILKIHPVARSPVASPNWKHVRVFIDWQRLGICGERGNAANSGSSSRATSPKSNTAAKSHRRWWFSWKIIRKISLQLAEIAGAVNRRNVSDYSGTVRVRPIGRKTATNLPSWEETMLIWRNFLQFFR